MSEKKYHSVKQIRKKYFPDTVEAERLGIESPGDWIVRIYAEIFGENKKEVENK